jgi:hypothetical protein
MDGEEIKPQLIFYTPIIPKLVNNVIEFFLRYVFCINVIFWSIT